LCVTRSCDWDIGQILLRKNFYRLSFTSPSLVRRFDPSKGLKYNLDHLIRVYIDNFHEFWWIYESTGTIQKICKETTLEDSRRLENSTWLST
jgi:hypothetical protein